MTTFFDTTRRILAILIGLSIPISTALTNILCPLAFLLILAEGQYKQKFSMLRQHPITVAVMLLFAIMLLGFLYTPVSFSEAGRMLSKYREFLYILLFLLIFRDNTTRQWGLYGFLSAMGIILFLSYLVVITGWHIGKGTPGDPSLFKSYITQSLLMALAAHLVAVQCWNQTQWWRWLLGIVVLLALYNILFISAGRTGYLILFCLIFLFFYQTYRLRGVLLGVIVLTLLSVVVYMYSGVLRERVNDLSESVQNPQQGENPTSAKMRLEFYKNSLTLIAQKPVFGYGTGSFTHEYKKLAEHQDIILTTNPHSDYLMIAVQWGLIGVGLFIFLLYVMWHATRYLETQPAQMAQGLVVTIAVGSAVNSLWMDNAEGHIFAYLAGVFYGGLMLTSKGERFKGLVSERFIPQKNDVWAVPR
jgi:O-antigen ligase